MDGIRHLRHDLGPGEIGDGGEGMAADRAIA
jgi:hypothetical protein